MYKVQLLFFTKRKIALSAIKLIKNGDLIFLDGSTSSYLVAEYLQEFSDISALTNGIDTLSLLAKNKIGLKNLFKIISFANTGFVIKGARIPRRIVDENREGLLIGCGCCNGEIFDIALTRCEEDLIKAKE